MSAALLRQKDLFTKRWRAIAAPQKEVTFHIQLVAMLRWCLRQDVLFRHVPNGEYRDPRTAAKLKAMGVLPGGADLEFHWCEMHPRIPHVKVRKLLHLELKSGKGQQSDAQVAFAFAVRMLGDEYRVARSIDEAIAVLQGLRLLRTDRPISRPGGRKT